MTVSQDPPRATGRAGELLGQARAAKSWPPGERARLWHRIEHTAKRRAAGRRRLARMATGTVALGTLGLALWLIRNPPQPPRARVLLKAPFKVSPGIAAPEPPSIDLPKVGHLRLSQGARYTLPSAATQSEVRLDSGELWAEIAPRGSARPFVVQTPELRVVVVGARFRVAASAERTRVQVEEGIVRVQLAGGPLISVMAGETIGSTDSRLVGPRAHKVTRAVAPVPESCAQATGLEERQSCYERIAQGADLAAQNALYRLALLDRDELSDRGAALAHFRSYEQRFPEGPLAPEVGLQILQMLLDDKQTEAAREQAEAFLRRFPGDPRASQVASIRAALNE